MGKIVSTTTDIHGVTTGTEVHTTWFEDFLLELVYRGISRNAGWRLAHRIEKWKLEEAK